MALDTRAVFAAGLGGLVIWSGIKGVSVVSGLRSLLTGKQPSTANIHPLGGTSAPAATGNAIADKASSYVGSGTTYLWGGGSPKGWDCSGFVNYVIGHDLGQAIPGYRPGTFNGSSHGPVTTQWALWSGVIGIPRSLVAAGDLLIWGPGQHMGIAVSNSQMVSAPGPNGTPAPIASNIDGWSSAPLFCRRLI